jgi:ADP-ribosylglycohydrolase
MKSRIENIESCFLGLAIGDALGVPVEFGDRAYLGTNPVQSMREYGRWHQPAGTWSDDSSLTFCLAESLLKGYDLNDIGQSFVKWMNTGYWGAHHRVFDIGGTTRVALTRLQKGGDPMSSGEFDVDSNGNGSIMRIAPAALMFHELTNEQLLERVREVSGITHRHFRSVFSCFVYSKIVAKLLIGYSKSNAYQSAVNELNEFIKHNSFHFSEVDLFARVLNGELQNLKEDQIRSSGYVLHTLEASLWCFLTTTSYTEAVLKAVNLGEDTDTTGCVTGALAGLYYGTSEIPVDWIKVLARKDDITNLGRSFKECLQSRILAKS